jgi:hypothetical protein
MSIRLWIVGDSEVNPVVEAISALGISRGRKELSSQRAFQNLLFSEIFI